MASRAEDRHAERHARVTNSHRTVTAGIRELGILREINEHDGQLEVVITPTYSGCPAMAQIEDDVRASVIEELRGAGRISTEEEIAAARKAAKLGRTVAQKLPAEVAARASDAPAGMDSA